MTEEMKCGQSISDACVGAEVTMNENGWKRLVDEAVSSATFLVTISLEMGSSEMPYNVKAGLNALRCALLNMGGNAWTLLAAAYYAAKQFGLHTEITKQINSVYEHVCTCKAEVKKMEDEWKQAQAMGMTGNSQFISCSEAGSNVQTE